MMRALFVCRRNAQEAVCMSSLCDRIDWNVVVGYIGELCCDWWSIY